jgi:hypothetical protein
MCRPQTVMLAALLTATMFAIAFIHPLVSYGYTQANRSARPRPNVPPGQVPTNVNTSTARTPPVNSKLMVFTVNGGGTTVTKTTGEFGSTLAASATVGKEFALQWTRTKPGAIERGIVYLIPPNSTAWVKVQTVTMQPQSTALDIQYSMPNVAPNTYEIMVGGDTGNSTRVTIKYNGQGSSGPSVIAQPNPTAGQPAPPKWRVVGTNFTPIVGSPNTGDYKRAKLTLTLEADADWPLKEITVEVYSEPFINSEVVTASGSKNPPIKLFTGTWKNGTGSAIHPGTPKVITIPLFRTSKGEVYAQEAGPGIYGPADWKIAFAQTKTASFRWLVDGKLFGSAQQSPQKQWQTP